MLLMQSQRRISAAERASGHGKGARPGLRAIVISGQRRAIEGGRLEPISGD
jgi:hypothetical protein